MHNLKEISYCAAPFCFFSIRTIEEVQIHCQLSILMSKLSVGNRFKAALL